VKSVGRTIPSNKQVTGMRGVYLVAAELSKRVARQQSRLFARSAKHSRRPC
jgi:hypothetical protein